MPAPRLKALRARAPTRRGAPIGVGLKRETVIATALDLIDRDGLEGFSIRNLGKELGVNPTAVMWHIGNRNALLTEVASLVHSGLVVAREGRSWQDWLREMFRRERAIIRKHPNVAPLFGTELVSNAQLDCPLIESILATLSSAGFTGASLVQAYSTVICAMVGFPAMEFAAAPSEDTAAWQQEMKARLKDIDSSQYPNLSGNLPLMLNKSFILRWENGVKQPMDATFEFYTNTVIAGLEAMRPRKGR